MHDIRVYAPSLEGYALLDSGDGKKLEQIGSTRIVRSEPRAWWKPLRARAEWERATVSFAEEGQGGWRSAGDIPTDLALRFDTVVAHVKFVGTSKHIGVFPEQASQWRWMSETIRATTDAGRTVNVLNIFGYTGVGTLVAAAAGAAVTHLDGSRAAIGWARENQDASGLSAAKIRWILDDAMAFVKREAKRGVRYDAIIMDPPSYGRGPKGQVWKVEDDLVDFLAHCRELLSADPLFVVLNMYSTELSALSLGNLVEDMTRGLGGRVECGELALPHEGSERMLPLSICASWRAS